VAVLCYWPPRQPRNNAFTRGRTFYGRLRFPPQLKPPHAEYTRTLYHGTIIHGTQVFSSELRTTPTSYYARDSGVGLALDLCCGTRPRRVGTGLLGARTLAAYGRKGGVFRFHDIQPPVQSIAPKLVLYTSRS